MKVYGIFGAGGYGREVSPQVKKLVSLGSKEDEVVFVDDKPEADVMNGYKILSFEDFDRLTGVDKALVIAIGDGDLRNKVANRCTERGLKFFSTLAENSVILDEVDIGEGAIISSFVTITSNVKIGKHFHANIYSYVAHDCQIGDFVTFAPRVNCNGNVVIEDYAYIGTGAVLRQGSKKAPLRIGQGAVVGMGAVVTKDVPPGATVVGNPARPMSQKL